jgi:hypothetical protein
MVKIVSFSMFIICHGQNCQLQHSWNVSWSKLSVTACLQYIMVKIVHFSMAGCVMVKSVCFSITEMCHGQKALSGICYGQNHLFQHVWNSSWSKLSVSAWLDVSWSKSSVSAWLECVTVKNGRLNIAGLCLGLNYSYQHV